MRARPRRPMESAVSAFASTPYNVAVGGTDFGDTVAGTNSNYWNSTNSANLRLGNSLTFRKSHGMIPAPALCSPTYFNYSTTYGAGGFLQQRDGHARRPAGSRRGQWRP